MNIQDANFTRKSAAAKLASGLLRALAHPCRLQILCALAEKERCVGDLTRRARMSQSALSQHLARLRAEGIVATRRDSQTIYYRIHSKGALEVVGVLIRLFCLPTSRKRRS